MIINTLIALVTVVTVSLLLFLKRRVTYWHKRNVFTLPTSIFFGNAKEMILQKAYWGQDFDDLYQLLKSRNERYAGYYILWTPIFFVRDLELVRTVLTKDFQHFTDHMNYVNEEVDPLTGHLFLLKGAKWKALRTKLTPTFTSGKLKGMFQTIVDCTKDLPTLVDEGIKQNQPLDTKETFARYTTDVIGNCAFGIECNCLRNPNTEFRMYGRKAFENDFLQALRIFLSTQLSQKFLSDIGYSVTRKDVENFFINLVKQTVAYRENNNITRKDFLQLLLDLRNREITVDDKSENGEIGYYQNGLTMNEIAAQAFVFFLAGFETSSTTLTFLMYELTENPDVQEKLRKEINEVIGKYNGDITYDSIMEMTYLDKCVQETLRKYPPLHVISRECTKDYKVPDSNLVIEKGTPVFISAYAIQRDPDYYPDPEKFDPERFSEENKNKRPPFTFLAFGEGPRLCIGLRFGVLQVKVGLVALLRRYKFTLNSKTITPLQYDPAQFILTVKGGVWVDAEKVTEV